MNRQQNGAIRYIVIRAVKQGSVDGYGFEKTCIKPENAFADMQD